MNVYFFIFNFVLDIFGLFVCYLNFFGINIEDFEFIEWLRENGVDEDIISRVKKIFCGISFFFFYVIVWGVYCELVIGEILGEFSLVLFFWG